MEKGKNLLDATAGKISAMENWLSGALKPVRPRQEFVHGLRHRFEGGGQVTLVNSMLNWHVLVLLISGLIALATLLAMVVRALLVLSERKRAA
jgi:hypothetical protein